MSKTTIPTGGITADAIDATLIADDAISEEHLDATAITGHTALAAEPADTDEFLISDAGTLKRIDAQYVAGGNLVKITSGTWGNGTDTLSLSNIFTTTYKHYIFYLTNVRPTANAGVALQIETSGDGSYATGSNYHYVLTGRDAGGNLTNTQDNNASKIEFQAQAITGNNASKRGSYIIDIFDPMDSSCYTHINTQATYHDSDGNTEFNKGAGVYLANTAVTGFRVLLSSGTIQTTGANYIVYGLKQ